MHEPVIIVHGTFANDADWWKPASNFCAELDRHLALNDAPARCWSGPARAYDSFAWSGANSQLQRLFAAEQLFFCLNKLETDDSVTGVHIIAHSHGGNIANEAITRFGSLNKVRTFISLGTPFFKRPDFHERINRQLALMMPTTIMLALLVSSGAAGIAAYLSQDAYWKISAYFSLAALLFFLMPPLVEDSLTFPKTWAKILTKASQHYILLDKDEAYHFLKQTERVFKSRFGNAKMLVDQKYTPFIASDHNMVLRLRASYINSTYTSILRAIFTVEFKKRLLSDIERKTTPVLKNLRYFLTCMYFLFDYAIVRTVRYITFPFRVYIYAYPMKMAYYRVMGNDCFLDPIVGVQEVPDCNYSSGTFPDASFGVPEQQFRVCLSRELQTRIEERARQWVVDVGVRVGDVVYARNNNFFSPEAMKNVWEELARDQSLIHSQYYQDEAIIEVMAQIIAGKPVEGAYVEEVKNGSVSHSKEGI